MDGRTSVAVRVGSEPLLMVFAGLIVSELLTRDVLSNAGKEARALTFLCVLLALVLNALAISTVGSQSVASGAQEAALGMLTESFMVDVSLTESLSPMKGRDSSDATAAEFVPSSDNASLRCPFGLNSGALFKPSNGDDDCAGNCWSFSVDFVPGVARESREGVRPNVDLRGPRFCISSLSLSMASTDLGSASVRKQVGGSAFVSTHVETGDALW